MVECTCSTGQRYVGDLWRTPGGWMELLPPGEPALVLQWLDVVSLYLLSPREAAQVTRRLRGGVRERRHHKTHKAVPKRTEQEIEGEWVLLA
jgi:hypothetical protein